MDTIAKLATMNMYGRHKPYLRKVMKYRSYQESKKGIRKRMELPVEMNNSLASLPVVFSRHEPELEPKETVSSFLGKRGLASLMLKFRHRNETCWIRYQPQTDGAALKGISI